MYAIRSYYAPGGVVFLFAPGIGQNLLAELQRTAPVSRALENAQPPLPRRVPVAALVQAPGQLRLPEPLEIPGRAVAQPVPAIFSYNFV